MRSWRPCGFPAIGKGELIRYITLTPADEAFLRPQTVLGAAVQLCTLPWLGFAPDEVPAAPPAAVGRLVRQLGVPVEVLGGYAAGREIPPVLADIGIPDEDVGMLLREKLGMECIRAVHAAACARLPRDHGHLWLLEGSYDCIRQFAPKVVEAGRFAGGTEAKPLIEALEMLRELNATGARNVPTGAPTLFVPTRWQGYLDEAAATGDATAYRHWELCVLLALRDGLRSGDVYVPGSRRYDNPAAYLFTAAQWEDHRAEFCRLVGKSPDSLIACLIGLSTNLGLYGMAASYGIPYDVLPGPRSGTSGRRRCARRTSCWSTTTTRCR